MKKTKFTEELIAVGLRHCRTRHPLRYTVESYASPSRPR